jgi:hypothetical protein
MKHSQNLHSLHSHTHQSLQTGKHSAHCGRGPKLHWLMHYDSKNCSWQTAQRLATTSIASWCVGIQHQHWQLSSARKLNHWLANSFLEGALCSQKQAAPTLGILQNNSSDQEQFIARHSKFKGETGWCLVQFWGSAIHLGEKVYMLFTLDSKHVSAGSQCHHWLDAGSVEKATANRPDRTITTHAIPMHLSSFFLGIGYNKPKDRSWVATHRQHKSLNA